MIVKILTCPTCKHPSGRALPDGTVELAENWITSDMVAASATAPALRVQIAHHDWCSTYQRALMGL